MDSEKLFHRFGIVKQLIGSVSAAGKPALRPTGATARNGIRYTETGGETKVGKVHN